VCAAASTLSLKTVLFAIAGAGGVSLDFLVEALVALGAFTLLTLVFVGSAAMLALGFSATFLAGDLCPVLGLLEILLAIVSFRYW
jgi:hypothetical protein